MKHWKRSTQILLLASLVLGLVAVLPPSTLLAYMQPHTPPHELGMKQSAGPGGAEDWLATPAAQLRTLEGDCPANFECLELCVNGGATGNFDCWPKNSW